MKMLVNSLRIIRMFNDLQSDNDCEVVKENKEAFSMEFTPESLATLNSQKSIFILHLLFECHNGEETATRFRDNWPIYESEKNLESKFRSTALKWLKEIILENQTWFPSINPDALAGMLVNPSGDRFIELLENFTNMIMYNIMSRQSIDESASLTFSSIFENDNFVLAEPIYTGDPQITSRQLYVLACEIEDLIISCFRIRKTLVVNSLQTKYRLKKVEQREIDAVEEDAENSSTLSELINHLEEVPAFEDNEELPPLFSSEKVKHIYRFLSPNQRDLVQAVKMNVAMKTKLVTENFDLLIKTQRKLFGLYSVLHRDGKIVYSIDWAKIFSLNNEESSTKSISGFINSMYAVCLAMFSDPRMSAPAPSDLLEIFNISNTQLKYVRMMLEKNKNSKIRKNLSSLNETFKRKCKELEFALKDVNWNELSEMSEFEFKHEVKTSTPRKSVDEKGIMDMSYGPGLNDSE